MKKRLNVHLVTSWHNDPTKVPANRIEETRAYLNETNDRLDRIEELIKEFKKSDSNYVIEQAFADVLKGT